MKIDIKKLNDRALLPTRGSEQAAGWDLYSNNEEAVNIEAHATVMIGTGLSLAIPDGYFGAIYARSGLATKQGLRPANCVGVIDSDYRGELIVSLHNDTNEMKTINQNERIAQLVVMPYLAVEFSEKDILDETSRGNNGFGSTGIK
nr:dUTP diphosphatase [uncultured Lachnoclostridium sp.]